MLLNFREIEKFVQMGLIENIPNKYTIEELLDDVSFDLTLETFEPPRSNRPFYLGITNEFINLGFVNQRLIKDGKDYILTGMLSGKSSLARRGISIEFANIIKPTFNGKIVLEINDHTGDAVFDLEKDMKIAQIVFIKTSPMIMEDFILTKSKNNYDNQNKIVI